MRFPTRSILNGTKLGFLRSSAPKEDPVPESVIRFLEDGQRPPPPPVDLPPDLAAAIDKGREHLLGLQDQRMGFWAGELEADVTLNAEYILLLEFLGVSRPEKVRKLARHILNCQLPDGSWNICHGGPGNLSATIESYFALKLAGHRPEDPPLARAKDFILEQGGIMKSRVLTKIYLAYFGQFDWKGIPHMPIELIFMPKGAYFNIYEFACWARAYTVPLLVINALRPSQQIPPEAKLDELYVLPREEEDYSLDKDVPPISWKNLFAQADKILKVLEKNPIKLSRGAALRRAERWIIEHQDESGDWGGIFPAIANSLMALRSLGYPLDDPIIMKGLDALDRFQIEEGDVIRQQPSVSPVWDTGWALLALGDNGQEASRRAREVGARFLAASQIRRPGDWSVKDPDLEPGGWAFQFYNDFYPDIDDSAVVLMALADPAFLSEPESRETFLRGLRWVLGMQNDDGGWGAFEKNVDNPIYDHLLYNDCRNMLDPSTPDVTARALELMGRIGFEVDHPSVSKAIAYLEGVQEPDGSWFGRWGVNYIYGTWSVLSALRAIGIDSESPMVRRGVGFLISRQNEDGGWGESCLSYEDRSQAGRGASTASQTAWALLGLTAGGYEKDPRVRKGFDYLIRDQREDGSWNESEWTGTGFPGAFYLRYHYYCLYFPLLALTRRGISL